VRQGDPDTDGGVSPHLLHVPILVATDGQESSAGALRLAKRLADLHHHDVELVTAGDRSSSRRVNSLLDDLFTAPPIWAHTILPGDLATALGRVSGERRAALVLVGASSARRAALDVVTSVLTAVLSVPADVIDLPHKVLMALDFSQSSVRAAQAALGVIARPARAFMVSVRPLRSGGEDLVPHEELLFDAVETTVVPPPDVTTSRHRVAGEVPTSILQLAATHRVDLISIGRRGLSTTQLKHPPIGSAARAILSTAPCTVLVGASSGSLH